MDKEIKTSYGLTQTEAVHKLIILDSIRPIDGDDVRSNDHSNNQKMKDFVEK